MGKRDVVAHSQVQTRRLTDRRLLVAEYKMKIGCESCGENDPDTLEFHHPNQAREIVRIGRMLGQNFTNDQINEEIAHCYVVCRTCHQKIHSGSLMLVSRQVPIRPRPLTEKWEVHIPDNNTNLLQARLGKDGARTIRTLRKVARDRKITFTSLIRTILEGWIENEKERGGIQIDN